MNLIPIKQEITDGFNSTEITISWGGYAEVDSAGWRHNDVCSSFSRVYFIKDGCGNIRYGDTNIKLRAGYMYLIPIGLKFSYSCDDKMTQIFFHINMYNGVRGDLLRCCDCVKEAYAGDEMIDTAQKAILSETFFDVIEIKKLLYTGIRMCLEKDDTDRLLPRHSVFVGDVIKYVNANLSMKLRTEDIAERFSVSRSTLCRRFKEEMGVTLRSYIEDSVFYWAEKMLVEERYSIGQISDMVGFCDQFHFSKRFMARFDQSPANYRRLHL